jgi:hypothetical protein
MVVGMVLESIFVQILEMFEIMVYISCEELLFFSGVAPSKKSNVQLKTPSFI